MTVTILVPVYGVEKFIAECAESLFSQSYEDIEYVFCDDCSPDRSIDILREVLQKYPNRKPFVRIVKQERNGGLGAARVRLLKEVNSPLFCIVDSDDVLPVLAVETLVRRMQETNTDIVDGAYADYFDGRILAKHCAFHGSERKYLRRILCQNIEPNRVWGKLYRSEVLQKLPDMFFAGIDYSEDFCATSRLAVLTTRAWTDEVVYLYRRDNATSYTAVPSRRNNISYIEANNKVLQFYRRRGHLPLALEIGLLNVYRQKTLSATLNTEEIDTHLRYVPEHYRARLLYSLLRGKRTHVLGDWLYRAFRIFCC